MSVNVAADFDIACGGVDDDSVHILLLVPALSS
jgi:hypothetical protein